MQNVPHVSSAVPYADYIRSRSWRALSRRTRERRGACEACGAFDDLHTHHRTYAHVGRERPGELAVLCGTCHYAVHDESRRMREPLDMVTERYIRTHRRILGALRRNAEQDALAERQARLRAERAKGSG